MIKSDNEILLHYERKDLVPKKDWIVDISYVHQYNEDCEFGFSRDRDKGNNDMIIEFGTGEVRVPFWNFWKALLSYFTWPIRFRWQWYTQRFRK